MLTVGLTGGIGSGKTIVSKVFEILGAPVYNSDTVAKYLMNHSPDVKQKLIEAFGKAVYAQDGILDRKYLAKKVFNRPQQLQVLNQIVHPEVRKHFNCWIKENEKARYIIKEAAILIESQTYKELDKLIVVVADKDLRIKRVVERDTTNRNEVLSRMQNQLSDDEKRKYADYIIYNNEKDFVLKQILDIHHKLIKNI